MLISDVAMATITTMSSSRALMLINAAVYVISNTSTRGLVCHVLRNLDSGRDGKRTLEIQPVSGQVAVVACRYRLE